MSKALRSLRRRLIASTSIKKCRHSGPCGPEHHGKRGGGWCANCYLCS